MTDDCPRCGGSFPPHAFNGHPCQGGVADTIAALRDENRILRGLVQTNPGWRCPHGMAVTTIAECPSGFPGCACADDRISVLCEDGSRLIIRLRKQLAEARADSELLAKARVAALRYAECPVNVDDRPESWDRLSAMMDALGVDPNTSPRDAREALRKLVGEES